MTVAAAFVEQLAAAGFPSAFNPYRDRCQVHDLPDAPGHRRHALLSCIESASNSQVDSFWIARDLGYRGGRRTGLALTDDVHLLNHAARWAVTVERATRGAPIAERTAVTTWGLLDRISERVFLWNVFPLHPHEADDELTNRQHTAAERAFGIEALDQLIRILRPRRLICIGNDAVKAVDRIGTDAPVVPVRHPSYGGTTIFERQISELYGLEMPKRQMSLL